MEAQAVDVQFAKCWDGSVPTDRTTCSCYKASRRLPRKPTRLLPWEAARLSYDATNLSDIAACVRCSKTTRLLTSIVTADRRYPRWRTLRLNRRSGRWLRPPGSPPSSLRSQRSLPY